MSSSSPDADDRQSRGSSASERTDGRTSGADAAGRREVAVPMRLYKTVTVFSTLLAVLFVILGFSFLDAATVQTGLVPWLVGALPAAVRPSLDANAVRLAFAFLGVACIGLGAGVYVLGSRFTAEGMGKDKDGEDAISDDG